MGLFKKSGNSSRSDTRSVFQPFTLTRRLARINEEESDSEQLSLGAGHHSDGKQRKTYPKGTPSKEKATPTKTKHRFHKLVEWDYGTEEEEPYEPPQDFLTIQKNQTNLFYENGPRQRKVVNVKSSSLDDVIRRTSNEENSGGDNSSLNSFTLFQFAADTASLSKSCSSDSSAVSSSVVSLKRQSTEEDVAIPYKALSSGSEKPKKIPKLSSSRADGPSVFHNTRDAEHSMSRAKTNFTQDINEKANFFSEPETVDSHSSRFEAFGSIDNPNDDQNSSKRGQERVEADNLDTFAPEMHAGSQNDFISAWPSESVFSNNDGQETFKPFPVVEERLQEPLKSKVRHRSSRSNSALSARAKTLVEESQALINKNEALFQANGSPVASKRADERSATIASPFEEATSPLKENEHSGPSFHNRNSVFRRKNTHFEKGKHTNPVIRVPPPQAEPQERHDKAPPQVKILGERDYQNRSAPPSQMAKEQMVPQRQPQAHSQVSFRFEFDNTREHVNTDHVKKGHGIPAEGHIRRNPQKMPHTKTAGSLGAIPQLTSPDSLHLFVDRVNSYDGSVNKKESFASTLESCDSNSTTTSASTFEDSSPRGIRGGFPNHLAPSSSTLSTTSTNILNEVDQLKPSHMQTKSHRPPRGVPPSSIVGSMLFQSADQDGPSSSSLSSGNRSSSRLGNRSSLRTGDRSAPSIRTFSPKRDKVPQNIHASDDAAISDISGNTSASDWMIQGNKLLSRYYYNDASSGQDNKKDKIVRQLRSRENQRLDYQKMVVGNQRGILRQQAQNRNKVNEFVANFNERHDPVDKMRRHQHQFQYPSRQVRSGFDNQEDADADSLFEA